MILEVFEDNGSKNMKNRLGLVVFLIALSGSLLAQTIQSNGVGGGNWDNPASWQGGVVPTLANSSYIYVRPGDNIQIPTGLTLAIDQLVVDGIVTVNSGGTLQIADGANLFNTADVMLGGRMYVFGILELNNLATIYTPASNNAVIRNGGIFRFKYANGGTVLSAVWDDGSTLEFTGYTSGFTNPKNVAQNFYNVVWNCPSMSAAKILSLLTVRGNLSILSTGSSQLKIFDAASDQTLNVQGSVIVSGSANVAFVNTGLNNVVNIGGSLLFSSSNSSQLNARGTITFNINGDFSHSAGSMIIANYTGGLTTLNIGGNVNLGGSISTSSGGVGVFNYVGNTTHSYTSSILHNGVFNTTVQSGSTLTLGTSVLTGYGNFTLQSGAVLRLGATDALGALQNNTTGGNIRVPVAQRTFASGSTIVYSGIGAQAIGAGHPNNSGISVIIDNPTNVSLLQNLTALGVTLNQGGYSAGSFNNTITNWVVNNGSFNPGTGTVVFTGAASLNGSGVKNFGNLTLAASASLSFPSDDVFVSRNLTVNAGAVLSPANSTLVLTGANNQTISVNGTTFSNVIEVSKSAGTVSLTTPLNLSGTINFLTATTLLSNGNLTLLSIGDKPAVDGAIGPLPVGAAVVGNVTVQRYFGASDGYDRFISSPVSNATVAQLQAAFPITGQFTGTSYPCTGCLNNGASLNYYSEAVSGTSKEGYFPYPSNGGSNLAMLTPGFGYSAYMWNGIAPVTINFVGTINSGSISLGASLGHRASTPTPIPSADGWNMVGNPYPSAIQWNNGSGWTRNNIDPTVWVWDVVGRIWRSYNANTSAGNLTNGVIASGQAFWVYAPTVGASSITVNEQAKSGAGDGSYYRQKPVPVATIQLKINGTSDEAYIVQSDEATSDYDAGLDALKLQLGIEHLSLSILDGNQNKYGHFAIAPTFAEELKLALYGEKAGYYELFISPGLISELLGYYLVDAEAKQSILIDGNIAYGFAVDNSLATVNRFYITKTPPDFGNAFVEDISVICFPNPVEKGELTIKVTAAQVSGMRLLDQMGKVVTEIAYLNDEGGTFAVINMDSNRSGIYFVSVLTDKGIVTKKVIKQ